MNENKSMKTQKATLFTLRLSIVASEAKKPLPAVHPLHSSDTLPPTTPPPKKEKACERKEGGEGTKPHRINGRAQLSQGERPYHVMADGLSYLSQSVVLVVREIVPPVFVE